MTRRTYRSAVEQYLREGPGASTPPRIAQTLRALDPLLLGLNPRSVTEEELADLRATLERLRADRAAYVDMARCPWPCTPPHHDVASA